ncbi:integrase core domain-containing protein [Methylorubrum extorquens]|uniref:integrase core domain-containing protein n=1 Tax=Methylorubrum extorquens TaxID=408 RepID=UPI0009B66595
MDDGPETAPQIQGIAPGSPGENGSCERFDGTRRNECRRQADFCTPKAAQAVTALWHNTCNRVRMFGASLAWC